MERISRRRFLQGALGLILTDQLVRPALVNEIAQQQKVEEPAVSAQAYLTLPFAETDLMKIPFRRGQYDVTEGWFYSQFERSVHGYSSHGAVDIAVPLKTPLYAPCSGYAIGTFADRWLYDQKNRIRTYQGKPMRFGLGYFVQIYNPDVYRYVILAHLYDIDESIPFSLPRERGEDWLPSNHDIRIQDMPHNRMVKWVNKGDPIGQVGISGIGWGYRDHRRGATRPVQLAEDLHTWDETHLHFEEFWVDQRTGLRVRKRDLYGLYSWYDRYRTPLRDGQYGLDRLLLLDSEGLPELAR